MGYLISGICILLAMLSYKIEKNLYNPATIMLGLWSFIFFIYELKLFGIYSIEDYTYGTIALGLFFFFIGYITNTLRKKHLVIKKRIGNVIIKENINYRILKFFGVVVLLFYLIEAIETIQLIHSGISLFDIRTSLQGYAEYSFSDTLYTLRSNIGPLYTWLIVPVYNSLLIFTCIDVLVGKKDKLLIILSIACILLKSFKEGSRVTIFNFVIYFIFSMMIYGKTIKLTDKSKKRAGLIVLIASILMIIITNFRISSGRKTLFEEIYMYFTCCLPICNYWFTKFYSSSVTEFTYGATSLYGLIQFPVTLISIFLGKKPDWYLSGLKAIEATEQFIPVRNTVYSYKFNAYTTMFYYFYKDAGIIGIILLSFLFGYISTSVYKNMEFKFKSNLLTIRVVCVYLLLIQAIVLSFIRINFSIASYSFTFVYLFIFVKKSYISSNKV